MISSCFKFASLNSVKAFSISTRYADFTRFDIQSAVLRNPLVISHHCHSLMIHGKIYSAENCIFEKRSETMGEKVVA